MVVVMQPGADARRIEEVIARLSAFGFDVHRSSGTHQTVLGAIGVQPDFDVRHIRLLDGVADVYRVTEPYKFASRADHKADSVVTVGGVPVGGPGVVVMAGPSAVESADQIDAVAKHAAAHGARVLSGAVFEPRATPYGFSGLGVEGLELLRDAARSHGLAVVTEVPDPAGLEAALDYVDLVRIGARNMQNYPLLRAAGRAGRPVLLRRGAAATIEEWLMSAEFVLAEGNPNVILCESGIRTFETYTRRTLDLSAVPVVKRKSHLPIVVDPSHATGLRDKVTPLARAAVAAGADGLLVECHPDPPSARANGPQALFPEQFEALVRQVRLIADAIGRSIA